MKARQYTEEQIISVLKEGEAGASTVFYLASDDAAFIAGQPISIDGGEIMV